MSADSLKALLAGAVLAVAAMAAGAAPPATASRPASAGASPTTLPAAGAATQPAPQARTVTVVRVTGRAQKLPPGAGPGGWQDLQAGQTLDERTVVRTGLRSSVTIKFQDRAEVVIEDATKIGITEFLQRGPQVRAQVGLKYGTVRVDVPKAGGPTDFSVSTPVATLSVRGTAGHVGYSADAGMHILGLRGLWRVLSDNRHLSIGPGEQTTGSLIPSIVLLQVERSTYLVDYFGVDSAETKFLVSNGGGRGVTVISSNQQSHNTVPPTGDAGGVILVPGGDIDVGGRPRSAK